MTNLFRLAENTSRESEVFNAQIQQKRGGSAAPSSSALLLCVMLGRHVLNKNTITHISEQFYYTPLSVFCKPIRRYFITFIARALSCSLITLCARALSCYITLFNAIFCHHLNWFFLAFIHWHLVLFSILKSSFVRFRCKSSSKS